jgi:hypothetical protein
MRALPSVAGFGADASQWRVVALGFGFMLWGPFVSFAVLQIAICGGLLLASGEALPWAAALAITSFTLAHLVGLLLACFAPADLHGRRYARAAGLLTVLFILSVSAWGVLDVIVTFRQVQPMLRLIAELTSWFRDETFVRVIGVTLTIHLGIIGGCWLLFLGSICDCLQDGVARRGINELFVLHVGFTALVTFLSTLASGCFVVMLLNPFTYFWHLIAVAHIRERLQAALR